MIPAPLAMAGLATASVGLWTLRVALTARGRKAAGAIVAAVEAVVFAMAFTRLGEGLDAPSRVGGYAAGVAVGTLLGLALDQRLSAGRSELRIVAPGVQPSLAHVLQRGGCPPTWLTGEGPEGPVTLIFVTADDRRLPALDEKLRRTIPGASWTVHPLSRRREPVGRPAR